jgi:hypothetical protein
VRSFDFVPTQRPTSEEITIGNVSFKVWDLGGHEAVRVLWQQYEMAADAIVFVIDSADRERLREARAVRRARADGLAHGGLGRADRRARKQAGPQDVAARA